LLPTLKWSALETNAKVEMLTMDKKNKSFILHKFFINVGNIVT